MCTHTWSTSVNICSEARAQVNVREGVTNIPARELFACVYVCIGRFSGELLHARRYIIHTYARTYAHRGTREKYTAALPPCNVAGMIKKRVVPSHARAACKKNFPSCRGMRTRFAYVCAGVKTGACACGWVHVWMSFRVDDYVRRPRQAASTPFLSSCIPLSPWST